MTQIIERTVGHVIGLDGHDSGPATIHIGPDGDISSVRALQPDHDPSGIPDHSAIPLLADAHAHLAISDGVHDDPRFHTLEHVDRQLRHLATRGVGHLHSLGTDQRWLQQRLLTRLNSGDPGEKAFGYSAGVGFGAVGGWPPELTTPELRFRPTDPDLARTQVRELAELGCRTVKIWVDDVGRTVPKTPLPVVRAIVEEAHHSGLRTFAHIRYQEDAEALVALNVDVLAHSIRDAPMEQRLLDRMAGQGCALVPTLTREEAEYNFSLPDNPYLHHEFFTTSESAVVRELGRTKFSDDPDDPKRRLELALQNVARAHQAGVRVGLGTDSGFRMKLLGFAQHRELELLNMAGLSPSECLRAALETNQQLFASGMTAITPGVPASFFVVAGDPTANISATQRIRDVWVAGKRLTGHDTLASTDC